MADKRKSAFLLPALVLFGLPALVWAPGFFLAGTQGFRHRGKTNVAFCDGHVESLRKPYTADGSPGNTAPGCGFLSPDNRLYSLDKD